MPRWKVTLVVDLEPEESPEVWASQAIRKIDADRNGLAYVVILPEPVKRRRSRAKAATTGKAAK
jgi:hypothetical protein